MKILVLTKKWEGRQPGHYEIPRDISPTLAKCAKLDGAGEIIANEPFRPAENVEGYSIIKRVPSNKRGRRPAENKSALD